MGLTQRRAVLIVYGLCVALCVGAVMSLAEQRELLFLAVGTVGVLVFVCVRILGGMRLGALGARLSRDWQLRQAGNEARIEIERCAHALPGTATLEALWGRCQPALATLHVDQARLTVAAPDGASREFTWRSATCPTDVSQVGESWQVRLSIRGNGQSLGLLEITGEVTSDRLFVPERLELAWYLRDLLAMHLPRLIAETPNAET
jgi:hypothetical protein